MATYTYNTLATGEKDNAREVQRMVKVARLSYTMTGSESADETVRIFNAPAGAVVTGYSMVSDAIATTATIDLGITGSTDGIADGIDVAAAGLDEAAVSNVSVDGAEVFATFKTLGTPVAGKILTITVQYDHNT